MIKNVQVVVDNLHSTCTFSLMIIIQRNWSFFFSKIFKQLLSDSDAKEENTKTGEMPTHGGLKPGHSIFILTSPPKNSNQLHYRTTPKFDFHIYTFHRIIMPKPSFAIDNYGGVIENVNINETITPN